MHFRHKNYEIPLKFAAKNADIAGGFLIFFVKTVDFCDFY